MTMVVLQLSCSTLTTIGSVAAFTVVPSRVTTTTTTSYYEPRSLVSLMARAPEITDWKVLRNGAVKGIVNFHPEIENGDVITTSPLADPDLASAENIVVATKSGSKYKLLTASAKTKKAMAKQNKKQQQSSSSNNNGSSSSTTTTTPPPPTTVKLSGKSVGNGKYVLGSRPQRSTSGKSQLWEAFAVNQKDGTPQYSRPLKAKLSSNKESLGRENDNYQRATTGLFSGRFVRKLDYYPTDGPGGDFAGYGALVMEAGTMDLKALLAKRRGRGLQGRAMRDAAVAGVQCLQAMHSSNLVWTDLKSENFVVMEEYDNNDNSDDNKGLTSVKGIDLESAIPFNNYPVDYSPEACPPEFAKAFLDGTGSEFVLKPSYDLWSLGMMLYELSTGKCYFEGRSPSAMTQMLASDVLEPDVSAVEDKNLRGLVEWCLNVNPRKRPSVAQVWLHPYFVTSGIGSISF